MSKRRVTVIGTGHAGVTIAAYMSFAGAEVTLYDHAKERLKGISPKTPFLIEFANGKIEEVRIRNVTSNPAEAVKDSELIMVATVSTSHKRTAEEIAKHVNEKQMVVLNPGRTGGALEFLTTLVKCGSKSIPTIAEAQTLMFACRKVDITHAKITSPKRNVKISSLSANKTGTLVNMLKEFRGVIGGKPYFDFKQAKSCLETSLNNIGALFHPAPFILNYGRADVHKEMSVGIESDKPHADFLYYMEGISPKVAEYVEKLDKERHAVAAAYGVDLQDAKDWLFESYASYGTNLYYRIQNTGAYKSIKAPVGVDVRYVTEDVPTGLVPIAALGRIAGVPTPCMDALIHFASALYGTDFEKIGRNAESMGISKMTVPQIKRYFKDGVKDLR